ncbi:hypothetical protein XACJK48_4040007 [Xanthomonas citri pv. citri]|nr:hypothetical protein XAC3824_400026 [Xanthomonas citri pv. citri]CEE38489.1 hypothetical protein XAC902_490026 [Xanthomonas citri pv. citri]CEE38833.1 hypothetical protein XAC2911_350060 [Xanthomonas citri pv. citri]CEE59465.1 hypothetical protein XAC71A_450028 [Xanthomonas citri pv. citri]CEE87065.1 hypothetical protein XACLE20_650027 [Xanthomonas citri pv. citri]
MRGSSMGDQAHATTPSNNAAAMTTADPICGGAVCADTSMLSVTIMDPIDQRLHLRSRHLPRTAEIYPSLGRKNTAAAVADYEYERRPAARRNHLMRCVAQCTREDACRGRSSGQRCSTPSGPAFAPISWCHRYGEIHFFRSLPHA